MKWFQMHNLGEFELVAVGGGGGGVFCSVRTACSSFI